MFSCETPLQGYSHPKMPIHEEAFDFGFKTDRYATAYTSAMAYDQVG